MDSSDSPRSYDIQTYAFQILVDLVTGEWSDWVVSLRLQYGLSNYLGLSTAKKFTFYKERSVEVTDIPKKVTIRKEESVEMLDTAKEVTIRTQESIAMINTAQEVTWQKEGKVKMIDTC